MAVSSAVTVGSLALVLAAGGGLVGVSADVVLNGSAPGGAAGSAGSTNSTSRPPSRPVVPQVTTTAPPQKPHKRTNPRADPDAAPDVLVEVYNNSGITGLAAQKASLLEGAGWNVAATDNWYGNIPANTVYYPSQLLSAAKQLAKRLHVVRIRPAVAPMQFDRLTVIFTEG